MKYILVILTLTVVSISCSKTTPAGFWTNFRKDFIIKKSSDQGPWGGLRKILWKSETKHTFTGREFIEFATKNGWEITDTLQYDPSFTIMSKEDYNSSDYSNEILDNEVLREIEGGDNYIFVFKTGWIAVEPGNARQTEKNGFLTVNSDGTEVRIYHLWGE